MNRKKLTQKKIAAELGVSPTALSLILKDPETPRVSPEKRKRVLDFIQTHLPHRAPSRSKCRVILCLPEIKTYAGPIYGAISTGVQDACRERGWLLDTRMGGVLASREEIFADVAPDGVIAIVGSKPFAALQSVSEFTPVVVVNCSDSGAFCDNLDLDNSSGVNALMDLLHREGHREIVFLYDNDNGTNLRHHLRYRIETFFGACLEKGVSISTESFINAAALGPTREAPAYDAALELILQRERRPTAVFCFNDAIAAQFIHAVQRKGMSVPCDFSVTGYDDHAMSTQTAPRITTVRHDRTRMGRNAVEILAGRIANPNGHRIILREPSQVVYRDSHAKLLQASAAR